jgi:predicted nucleic acid-binding protein
VLVVGLRAPRQYGGNGYFWETPVRSTACYPTLNQAAYSIARLTLTEVISVFAKKVRTGEIVDADFDRLRLRFYADVRNRTVTPVRILNAHFESAGDLIARHGKSQQIHTLDALQLAVALSIQQPTAINQFICADQRLCDIALLEGLAVINPEEP